MGVILYYASGMILIYPVQCYNQEARWSVCNRRDQCPPAAPSVASCPLVALLKEEEEEEPAQEIQGETINAYNSLLPAYSMHVYSYSTLLLLVLV
jgi:hypothetical protein